MAHLAVPPTIPGTLNVNSLEVNNVLTVNNQQIFSTTWKNPVNACTTANITLLGLQTIDDVVLISNQRVLVKNQSTGSENGIYLVQSSNWIRSDDLTTNSSASGTAVYVEEGTVNEKEIFICTNAPESDIVGTFSLTFEKLIESVSAGGSNGQLQYNNSGVFGGIVGFTYNNSTGDLTVSTGDLTVSTGEISSSSITATTGDITATSGDIIALSGSLTSNNNITSTTGNITATAGSVSAGTTMTAGTGITSTTGDITATAGSVSAGTTMTAGTGITSTTGNIVASSGNITASGSITAGTGITITSGNLSALNSAVIVGSINAANNITSEFGCELGAGNNSVLDFGKGAGIATIRFGLSNSLIGFYGATAIARPTTSITEAAIVENSGSITVNENSTFDGYTLQQVVKALRNLGILT